MKQMKYLRLENKSGFKNTGNAPIVILDEFHRPFYDSTILDTRVDEFNLPAGEYYVLSGRFQQMAAPKEYKLSPLPRIQRKMHDPENFKINYLDNPHTASIYWDDNTIILDKSLRSLTMPELVYILYHEYGHRFYTNEEACDTYAMNRMLREGYNPEQIGESILNTLSDNNLHRKHVLIDKLAKNYGNGR